MALDLRAAMRKVRALRDGESCAIVMLDSREIHGAGRYADSLRVLVTRQMVDDADPLAYDAVLQQTNGLEVWEPLEEKRRDEEEFTAWRYLTLQEVATLLPFLQMVADREARWLDLSRPHEPALGVAA